ncbi:NUDIX hydrolase [Luteolibacter algae]|uniref:NUDIX hydrolase n=1 Tax=Luteolibacter algae TaxID=454151 RepID=A0ABW5D5M6_9BACT
MSDLLEFARELAAIGQAGITYSRDPYDRERFVRLREMAGEILQLPQYSPDFRWPEEFGYDTPKVDVRAIVFRDHQILLVRETSTGLWTVPGGWADVNLTPAENAQKECHEESGYEVKAKALLSIIDKDRAGYDRNVNAIYKIFFLCEIVGGEARTSIESSEVGFFDLESLPELDPQRTREADIRSAYNRYLKPELPAEFN